MLKVILIRKLSGFCANSLHGTGSWFGSRVLTRFSHEWLASSVILEAALTCRVEAGFAFIRKPCSARSRRLEVILEAALSCRVEDGFTGIRKPCSARPRRLEVILEAALSCRVEDDFSRIRKPCSARPRRLEIYFLQETTRFLVENQISHATGRDNSACRTLTQTNLHLQNMYCGSKNGVV